jgi:hypothetical protein
MSARGASAPSARRSAAARLGFLLACAAPGAAWAGVDVWMGVGAGVADDLGDAASAGETRLRAGPAAVVPVRFGLSPWLRLRVDLRFEVGFGVDQLTWDEVYDGAVVRRTDGDTHRAFVGALGGELGLEVQVPVNGPVRPFLAASAGVVGVGAYHALSEDTAVLLDPEQNRLGEPGNLDPYTVQPAVSYGVGAGAAWRARDRVDLWVEIGYGGAFLPAKALRKTPVDLDARREAFAWNPFRATVGVLFKL